MCIATILCQLAAVYFSLIHFSLRISCALIWFSSVYFGEKQPYFWRSRAYISSAKTGMQTQCLFPLVLFLVLFHCSSLAEEVTNGRGLLTLSTASPQHIEGLYTTPSSTGKGIHFDATASEDSHSLVISTQGGGERVLTVRQHTLDSPIGITLFGNHFIVSKGKGDNTRHSEYLFPSTLHKYFEPTLKHDTVFRYVRRHLDVEGVNVTRSKAISQLLAGEEVGLVIQAAKAVGESGLTGTDNPAAMMLYVLALRLQNLLDDRAEPLQDSSSRSDLLERTLRHQHHQPDWVGRTAGNAERLCESATCPADRCPRAGDGCLGLCGPACTCWEWVCGDCCLNKMCLDHDRCCEDGMLSWGCVGILQRHINPQVDCSKAYVC